MGSGQERQNPVRNLDPNLPTALLAADSVVVLQLLDNLSIGPFLAVDEGVTTASSAAIICLVASPAYLSWWPSSTISHLVSPPRGRLFPPLLGIFEKLNRLPKDWADWLSGHPQSLGGFDLLRQGLTITLDAANVLGEGHHHLGASRFEL